jgi:hypothetical protein
VFGGEAGEGATEGEHHAAFAVEEVFGHRVGEHRQQHQDGAEHGTGEQRRGAQDGTHTVSRHAPDRDEPRHLLLHRHEQADADGEHDRPQHRHRRRRGVVEAVPGGHEVQERGQAEDGEAATDDEGSLRYRVEQAPHRRTNASMSVIIARNR